MTSRPNDDEHLLSGAMCALSIEEDRPKELDLDDNVRAKMDKIKNDYESVFSWDIKRLTGNSQNLMSNLINLLEEKCEMLLNIGDVFDINRFYRRLIICYELYDGGNYKKSLCEAKNINEYLETCKFEDLSKQYSEACFHIARATYAFVSLLLNLDSEKIIQTIKPVKSLNQSEKAAIYAIKSRVFMEYPPKGNDVGLELADLARQLDSAEPEWIIIWLKAKGRVRRYHDKNVIPDKFEIDGANILCANKTSAWSLSQAAKVYQEVARYYKLRNSREESNNFYKISSNLMYNAIALAKDNVKLLKSCFVTCMYYPIEYQSKQILNDVIKELSSINNNSQIDCTLGNYYLIHKEYKKAKIYLSRAMASGHFSSALQLVKVECLLQPVHQYPLVNSLNLLYEVFPSPKRRLIILSQILLYYYYNDDNPKELMKYVKIYLEQDIETALKKHHLIAAFPLFKTNRFFKPRQFLFSLFSEVKYLKSHHKWTSEEKIIIDQTLIDFNDMMNAETYDNPIHSTNTNDVKNQSHNNDLNKRYLNKNSSLNSSSVDDKLNWRKKSVSSNKNDCQQLPSTSKNVMPSKTFEKPAITKESVHQNKKIWE